MALSGVEGTRARLEALLVVLAAQLDDPHEGAPVAALAAQYRSTVLAIAEIPASKAGGVMDELVARRAARSGGFPDADSAGSP